MEMMVKKRENYIDYAKAFAMLLVIVGHINRFNAGVKVWIYAFHMPMFFILSGFLLKQWLITDWKKNIDGKLRRIYVPYLLWALIYAGFSPRNLCFAVYGSYKALSTIESNTNLWFFPTVVAAQFIAENAAHTCSKLFGQSKHKKASGLVGVMFCILGLALPEISIGWPLNLDKAFVASGFILWGYFLREYIEKAGKMLLLKTFGFIAVSVFSFISFPDGGYMHMASGTYGNPILFVFFGLTGSIGLILLARFTANILAESQYLGKFLIFVGSNTFAFLAIQKPIINIISVLCERVGINGYPALCAVFCLTMGLCYAAVWLIRKYAPYLDGKVSC